MPLSPGPRLGVYEVSAKSGEGGMGEFYQASYTKLDRDAAGAPVIGAAEFQHPGEILLEEFLVPMGLSQNRIARAMGVPPRRINEIVHAKRSITADTALRLARYFGTSEQFWMGLQADHDLEEARRRFVTVLRLSPDGRQLVTQIVSEVGGGSEVWVYDLERDNFRAISQEADWNEHPIWSADGRSVVWTTDTLGAGDLLIRPADANAPARPLFFDEPYKVASDAHPSGKYVVSTPSDEQDLWVYTEDDPEQPEHFLAAPGMQWDGSFSPEGRHIVYDSQEFGATEVYVRPYPRREDGSDWFQQISRGGGESHPVWVADDRIVYRQGTHAMEVRVTDNGSELSFSNPVQLFDGLDAAWDIAPDGTYFVSLELIEPPRLMVVLDWFEELGRLVQTN